MRYEGNDCKMNIHYSYIATSIILVQVSLVEWIAISGNREARGACVVFGHHVLARQPDGSSSRPPRGFPFIVKSSAKAGDSKMMFPSVCYGGYYQ